MAGQIERPIPYIPITLQESFGMRPVSRRETKIIQIIDGIEGLNLPQKRDIYFYDLWSRFHKTAWLKIKNLVGEVREDELERVRLRVDRDNFMTEKYGQFQGEFLRQTQYERIPALSKLLEEGASLEDAAEETDFDLKIAGDALTQSFSLTPLQEKVALMRLLGLSRERIIQETKEKPGTIELAISTLIFMDVIKPKPNKIKQSKQFKTFCLDVERVYLEHPDWDYEQVAKELTTTKPQVKMARMILMGAKRLQPIMGAKERHRTEENIENEQAIYSLRRTEPNLSQTQIAKRLGLSLGIVQHYIARGVSKGIIQRKRPLPERRSKPQ